ncbi:sigma-70 family RNA polymerase sigma factor [Blastopirellula sp. JC732]|uniref:Sigma-70 family RNA polymerase sigma factor n=1 Tax=Blastopirellula sediminis TaxID=2894196 RepID=A0A9X1MQX3_9BACT|nr:sigma-70 family RNA polymerase sigma factor [Blastopirellula sediminis]MCC9605904.1 sigma-70 family RNA polymerase sigma factor [Blastopirellula sediminis]MCC9630797.1 sigma-70 family RNA polymerase sigma factor [Blastopirellula sediminis]
MADESIDIAELIRQIRRGQPAAAEQLFRYYEPEIRAEIRYRLRSTAVRRVVDSQDICQSVMISFFLRVGAGQYEIAEPQELLQLLLKIARNKTNDAYRAQLADKRDVRRVRSLDAAKELEEKVGREKVATNAAEMADLLQELERQLSTQEFEIASLRRQGFQWDEIGQKMGESPEALRKRFHRAVERIGRTLTPWF